jgi:hypothetical protein
VIEGIADGADAGGDDPPVCEEEGQEPGSPVEGVENQGAEGPHLGVGGEALAEFSIRSRPDVFIAQGSLRQLHKSESVVESVGYDNRDAVPCRENVSEAQYKGLPGRGQSEQNP